MKNVLNERKMKQSPPWWGYVNKIKVLFGSDPEIWVDFNEPDMILTIYVDFDVKAEAIRKLLPDEIRFGNASMDIRVLPKNQVMRENIPELFKRAFDGNPAVNDIQTVSGVFTNPITYVVFRKEVIQYYDDNLGDINGNKSTLMEQIARDIFCNCDSGIYFCTDVKEGE